eukprot:GGOE01023971.1.p1 GENE.GGOE01023971.1~~GGOE01023971.1.p1  ORF type:complete len:639 (+),score=148.94 GGOE01023971.1:64-1980(+)
MQGFWSSVPLPQQADGFGPRPISVVLPYGAAVPNGPGSVPSVLMDPEGPSFPWRSEPPRPSAHPDPPPSSAPPARTSRRTLIRQLNEEYELHRISREEYDRRWARIFDSGAEVQGSAEWAAMGPEQPPAPQVLAFPTEYSMEDDGMSPSASVSQQSFNDRLAAVALPNGAQLQDRIDASYEEEGGSEDYTTTTTSPADSTPSTSPPRGIFVPVTTSHPPAPSTAAAAPTAPIATAVAAAIPTEWPASAIPAEWLPAPTSQPLSSAPSAAYQHPAFASTVTEPPGFIPSPGFIPLFPMHPDPAPHLAFGRAEKLPGPRLNKNPPPPPSRPPNFGELGVPELPPPLPPQLMTFTAPPLLNGDEASPPEGELVTKYTYNFAAHKWFKRKIRVRLDLYPFQEGTLRSVFFMKDFSQPHGPLQDYVAKISKDPDEPPESYFDDCEMQALAAHYAEEFCQLGAPKPVSYIESAIIECHERQPPRPGARVLFSIEPYIHGTFIKYINNYGWINPGAPRHTPQAFAHFTWCHSQGTLLVVDVQGTVDHLGVDRYTDPQIHSGVPERMIFGKADLRIEGIRKFFETHECNEVCRQLWLPEGMDLRRRYWPPARAPVNVRFLFPQFPGVEHPDCADVEDETTVCCQVM